jgi:hypothetical protein
MLYAYIINWEHIIDFIDGEGCDEMGGVSWNISKILVGKNNIKWP